LLKRSAAKSSHGIRFPSNLFEINLRCHRGRGGTIRDKPDKLQ
jgi:hypothetical protein